MSDSVPDGDATATEDEGRGAKGQSADENAHDDSLVDDELTARDALAKLPYLAYAIMLPLVAIVYVTGNGGYPLLIIGGAELVIGFAYVLLVYFDRRAGATASRLWYGIMAVLGGTVVLAPVATRIYLDSARQSR